MTVEKSFRYITDADDVLIFSSRDNGAFFVEVMHKDSDSFISMYLTKNDLDTIEKIIHNEVEE